jgi:hypothetical protein
MQFVHTSLSIFANAKKVGQNNKTINLQLTPVTDTLLCGEKLS